MLEEIGVTEAPAESIEQTGPATQENPGINLPACEENFTFFLRFFEKLV